jgi:hypothetical protein
MVSLIACQGLRSPEELPAIEVRHVRVRTLLVEQRSIDGQIVAFATARPRPSRAGRPRARTRRARARQGELKEAYPDWSDKWSIA